MWKVEITKECQKRFEMDFKKGLFSKDDGIVIKTWVKEIEKFGPEFIQKSFNWNDHSLTRNWYGHRASCFSFSGRIIYKIIEDKVVVSVIRISPNHDYTKE